VGIKILWNLSYYFWLTENKGSFMKKLFLLLLLLPPNLFSIIINENMGDVNNWYDSTDNSPLCPRP